ncbi:MAG TPA: hypothetical protein VMN60_03180 [Longimicrobiales bacterium]|nr:hypothetical protein [Longimicrobiales bacterium]
MRRILIIVVIIAVAWAIPPVRGKLSTGAIPILEKLGPVGDVVITPVRRFSAKSQVTHILRLIANDYNEGRELPDERTFQRWLRRRAPDANANDPWGRPYWLTRGNGTLTVGSSGLDGRKGNGDDVKHTVPF